MLKAVTDRELVGNPTANRDMTRKMELAAYVGDIIGVPTVRETDGLAMSSRNRYLSDEERAAAVTLPNSLKTAIKAVEGGQPIAEALDAARASLSAAGFIVDYVEIVDAASLEPISALTNRPARILAAAKLGKTRLIDNMGLSAR